MSNSHELSLLFWNIWGHRKPQELERSLKEFAQSGVDVFCFTEVTDTQNPNDKARVVYMSTERVEPPSRLNGYDRLDELLSERYNLRFDTPTRDDWWCYRQKYMYKGVGFGSVIAWRKELYVLGAGSHTVAPDPFAVKPRVLQWVVINGEKERYLIAHLHGLWLFENSKGDHPLRHEQSKQVSIHLARLQRTFEVDKVVFGGDLNLDINTEALSILKSGGAEGKPMRNLIEEFGIESTRTTLYRKWSDLGAPQHADHVLVTPEVEVHDFDVAYDEAASDHAPLSVKIS